MSYRRTAVLFASLLFVACAPIDIGADRAPIIGGVRETGQPSVVAIAIMLPGGSGALCSGSVLGPHVVMTAKHCVIDETTGVMLSPTAFYVIPQDDVTHGISSVAYVSDIRTTPGTDLTTDINNGDDIALLLTSTPLTSTPLGYAVGTTIAIGDRVTVVGYGRTRSGTPDPTDSGLKYTGTMTISNFGSHLIETDGPTAATCQGDSGGPLFDTAGNVAGITSFGVDSTCVRLTSYYTRVSRHTALISDALTWAPPCMPTMEICNGVDDDCDGVADEGCLGIGDACTTDAQCGGGTCANIDGMMRCTRACVAQDLVPTCPVDTYCRETGCGTGECLPGGPGGTPDGAPCMVDGDCGSLHCGTVGGVQMCGRACNTGGAAVCPSGEVCDTTGDTGGCGECVPFAMSHAPRPFGAACGANADCASGMCTDAGAADAFCTKSCSMAADCGGGFHCRSGTCVPGDLGGEGAACVNAMDCAGSAPDCVAIEGDHACASRCTAPADCPDGFVCATVDDGSMHCAHPGAALGAPCTMGSECRSGLCAAGACLRFCTSTSPCPSGFDCVPTSDPSARVCYRSAPTMMRSSGGCSVGAGGGAGGAVLALGVLAVLARRRRR